MDKLLERLNSFNDPEARYAYADAVTNAFLTAQIKELREERGMTQEELAELLGTQQSGISRWQKSGYSSCKVETLRKFAKAFGVRLRITFEEFGSLPTDINGFTKERLTPRKFEDDSAFKAQPEPLLEEIRLLDLTREAACPCCHAGTTITLEPCQECHGKGLAIVAYDTLRIHYKSLQEYADNLKGALADALDVVEVSGKWLREGEPKTAENQDAANVCDEVTAYANGLGVIATSKVSR